MPSATTKHSLRSVHIDEGPDRIFEIYKEDGGVVIHGLLSPSQVTSFNREVDPHLERLKAGSTQDDALSKDFHGSNTKRLTNLVTYSKTFREHLLDNDLVHAVADKIFTEESGTYWMNTAQLIEIGPGNAAQKLHRDQSQYLVWDKLGPDGPEAVCNFFVALNDFTEENGATRVIPGSHKWPDYSVEASPDDTIPAEMNAGDVLLFGGKLIHGGGANRTKDFKRRGVAFTLQVSYLTPEEAYPFITEVELARTLSPRAQRMIAFRSQKPKNTPGLWQSNYSEIADVIF